MLKIKALAARRGYAYHCKEDADDSLFSEEILIWNLTHILSEAERAVKVSSLLSTTTKQRRLEHGSR